MTSSMSDTPESRPAELFQEEIAHLRSASGWTRFIGVGGFVAAGVLGLAMGLVAAAGNRFGVTLTATLTGILSVLLMAGAAHQLLGYSRDVRSFLANDGPALPRAFRSLRHFFTLTSLYLALTVAAEMLNLLGVK